MAPKPTSGTFSDQTTPMWSAGSAPLLPVVLRVFGTTPPVTFRLAGGSCFVGSSKGAHLVVAEPTVSRQHCEIELCPGGVRVTDLDSRNGTFYLGQRVDAITLPVGATFTVGNVTIAIQPDVGADTVKPSDSTSLAGMVGHSLPMRMVFGVVERVAPTTVPVLLEGEPGVGKGTVARAIHALSRNAAHPFETFLGTAAPREALYEELLGHGGALDRASGGTAYLRDVDGLPSDLQSALLARLETDSPSGSVAPPRIVCSTTKALEDEVRAGTFSSELFFRCSVVRIQVPPLRARREDIGALAAHFAERAGLPPLPLPILEDLKGRALPGNLRELESLVRAFGVLGSLPAPAHVRGSLLDLALEEIADPTRPYAELKDALVERFTARYLHGLMRHTSGNQSVAARLAGVDRTYLGRLLAKHNLR
ncbi:MAG: sigma 54-dependent Fis family transcriptional regulator [Myxococcales bacterium]|nr:sigma 54-dependent Fis family transcriptional regulator [Myxococcales bacterium]